MLRRLLISVCCLVLLSACSSKMAYNNLDWLIYWYVDDFIELNDGQRALADQKLLPWLEWHRSEELLNYRAHLEELKADVEGDNITAQRWMEHFERGSGHWLRLRDKVVPGLVEMAPQLSDEQVADLFEELEENNVEREKNRFEGTEEERIEERTKDMLGEMRDWIGKPTKAQKEIVKKYAGQMRSNFDNWLVYRRNIQSQAKMLFDTRDSDPEFTRKLAHLMTNTDDYRSEELLANSDHNGELYSLMVEEMFLSLTAKQKRRALREIDNLIDDLTDLMED